MNCHGPIFERESINNNNVFLDYYQLSHEDIEVFFETKKKCFSFKKGTLKTREKL